MRRTDSFPASAQGGGGIISLVFLVVAIYLGYLCADYLVWFVFGKDIPWYGDILIAIVTGDFVVPLALVGIVLNSFGVVTPPLTN